MKNFPKEINLLFLLVMYFFLCVGCADRAQEEVDAFSVPDKRPSVGVPQQEEPTDDGAVVNTPEQEPDQPQEDELPVWFQIGYSQIQTPECAPQKINPEWNFGSGGRPTEEEVDIENERADFVLVFPEDAPFDQTNQPYSANIKANALSLSMDDRTGGWVCYDMSFIPFSDLALIAPDSTHVGNLDANAFGATERWGYPLNDGWWCYLFRNDYYPGTVWHPADASGENYTMLIGHPGSYFVFVLNWGNYEIYTRKEVEEDPEREFNVRCLKEGDPGYLSQEKILYIARNLRVESGGKTW